MWNKTYSKTKKIKASPDVCSYKALQINTRFSGANTEYSTEITLMQNQQELFQKM